MSKIVKGVGKVIKGVAKVAQKVVKGVGKVVKSIAKSKIGKVLLAAATVYFGGAAIMGAVGGASAGTGFMGTISGAIQGAGAGITSAWNGLVGAGGALMGGQGLGAAGSSLSQGFMGAGAAGQAAVGGAAAGTAGAAPGLIQGAVTSPVHMGSVVGTPLGPAGAAAAPAAGGAGGWVSGVWNGLGEYGKMAAIQAGSQLAGGLIQGVGAQKQQQALWDREDTLASNERERRDQNMRTSFDFGQAEDSRYSPTQPGVQTPGLNQTPDPRLVRPGLIGGSMPGNMSSLDMFPRLSRYYS
jgi:hypothetical protein